MEGGKRGELSVFVHALDEVVVLAFISLVPTELSDDCGRNEARLATMSSISFKIAPSAATSDELLSNSESRMKRGYLKHSLHEI